MGKCWKNLDEFDVAEDENYIWHNNQNHNTPLGVKATITLDPSQIVVSNMQHTEEGSIKVCANCKKICELLTADSLESSQHSEMGMPLQKNSIRKFFQSIF